MADALIVEDGGMPPGANCYAGLTEADAWLVPRGLWPVTPAIVDGETGDEIPDPAVQAAKTAALLRAADWLNALPGGRWKSEPEEGRIMAFPRKCAPGVVPAGVRIANMELAAVIFGGNDPLAPLKRGGAVHAVSESASKAVGPLTESAGHSLTYAADAPPETYFPAVAGLLAPYLDKTPGKAAGGGCLAVGRG